MYVAKDDTAVLQETGSDRFKIKTISNRYAQITVVRGAHLDYEAAEQSFMVAVRVTDSGGPITAESPAITSGVDCRIRIIDVNDKKSGGSCDGCTSVASDLGAIRYSERFVAELAFVRSGEEMVEAT